MGVIQHNAVIATTWDYKFYERLKGLIDAGYLQGYFFCGEPVVNGYRTIVLLPDGSKEGWVESDRGDEQRKNFIRCLESFAYEDDSNCWSWVEVSYGELGAYLLTEGEG